MQCNAMQSLATIPNINRRETLNIQYVTFRDTKYNVGWTCLMAVGYRTNALVIWVLPERSLRKKSETVGDQVFLSIKN